jgi:hypothetical protein
VIKSLFSKSFPNAQHETEINPFGSLISFLMWSTIDNNEIITALYLFQDEDDYALQATLKLIESRQHRHLKKIYKVYEKV